MADTLKFVKLKSINGEPLLVNAASVRAVSTIAMAEDEVSVISFTETHELVVGSKVPEVLEAIEAATRI
ncbi:hypothetical protein [Stakelama tenebrarum]|uniref:Flagellar protein FlbD n=1 Tax=Stakelama tenebrarum TaxID=2711215 RepID=A0A6G6Y5L8_9SPHN|nr:hypothetical protein [Sphingosinithalassobacter tenebrarum]QIG80141.1 hypothetical protein G5C33_10350 [Sphingosinithalassobacter tenebrarum]